MDLTEYKLLENKSISLEAALAEQQRLKSMGTLVSGVAHEVNNPINGIMNYAQLIIDASNSDSDATIYSKRYQ